MNFLEDLLEKEDFNIQDLSKILKRETQTVRVWEKKGIISKADKRGQNNWRVYSRKQLVVVLEQILSYPWQRQVVKNSSEVNYVIDFLKNKIKEDGC
jgi:hypothetical protein